LPPFNGIHTVTGEPSPIYSGFTDNKMVYGLFNDTTYYFAISALDISGNESQLSPFVSATPRCTSTMLNLSGLTLTSETDTCFAAIQSIIVSDFIIENDAIVRLIAGENIQLLPLTQVHNGAHLHAFIDTQGNYCQQSESMVATFSEDNETRNWPIETIEHMEKLFMVFPNPTDGTFTLLLKEATESVIAVEIYSMLGERIMQTQLSGSQQYEFDLSARPEGVYLVRVVRGDEVWVEKVVKQ
jgi:hypothetical protein